MNVNSQFMLNFDMLQEVFHTSIPKEKIFSHFNRLSLVCKRWSIVADRITCDLLTKGILEIPEQAFNDCLPERIFARFCSRESNPSFLRLNIKNIPTDALPLSELDHLSSQPLPLPNKNLTTDFASYFFFNQNETNNLLNQEKRLNQLVTKIRNKCPNLILLHKEMGDEVTSGLEKLNLSRLDLSEGNFTGKGIRNLVKLTTLTSLSFKGCNLDNITDEDLCELTKLKGLTQLNFWKNIENMTNIEFITKFSNLTNLSFSYLLQTDVLDKISEHTQILSLTISDCFAKDKFQNYTKLVNLKSLNLSKSGLDRNSFQNIVKLTNLTNLNLSEWHSSPDCLINLSKLINLTSLNLRQNSFFYWSSNRFEILSKLVNLTDLDLGKMEHTFEDFEKITTLANLKFLTLGVCRNRGNGLKKITELVNLKFLSLDFYSIDSIDDLEEIAKQPNIQELRIGVSSSTNPVIKLNEKYPNKVFLKKFDGSFFD